MSTRIEIKAECAPSINLLIQNCCDPLIQEIISFDTPGLPPVGVFYDTEGNCWSLIGTTEDPVNSERRVDGSFGNCEMCVAFHGCPENLVVESCCATFGTVFSGALPGIGVGDTFSDTFGFCWNVTGTTPAPITGVVSVATTYLTEDCTTCLGDNICPDIYAITSCCRNICNPNFRTELFTTLAQLGGGTPGEIFVDQFGFCWLISPLPITGFNLLTGSFIQYASSSDADYCDGCIADNNACSTNVFYTIRNCETQDIEVVEALFGFSVGNSLLLNFTTDIAPNCWQIISWDNTSLPTKIIDDIFNCFKNCIICRNS